MEYDLQDIFKYLADDWRNRDATIIVHFSLITLTILHNRHDGAAAELTGNMPMEHMVEEPLETVKERERRVEEVLCTDERIICALAFFHFKAGIKNVFQ